MASISLKGVAKRWGPVVALEALDLEVQDQELMVLLGPSGCGKTTTMRMVAGLEDPSDGEVWIGPHMMNEVEPRDRDVAMVFQSYALYPNMTIYENIRFPLRMRNVPRAEQDRLVRRAAELVELGDYLERKPRALSGGQRQRAALARAVVRSPQVFLMDEPLSNLDAKLRQTMRVQLKHLQRELKVTTLYVTHDQIEAMTLADRVAVMNKGKIQQIGTPQEIYNDPATLFVAQFIGSPPMNLMAGRIEGGTFRSGDFALATRMAAPDGEVVLGVRPEDMTITAEGDQTMARVYGVEPTGDVTYVAVTLAGALVVIKAGRDFRAEIDTMVPVRIDTDRLFLFDPASERRIRRS
ncbi:MAG: ABC transporter ATP-binding protein [Geminicoccaceae bacterium]